ncbi:MAG: hypothetical protein IJU87_04335, partial [Lachnospiraceae bacterium]|nr:hypothetical protein [Lachnospiraceae bacterium]
MSFNAFDANHKDVDISAGIPKDISIEDTFFCYGCNCDLHIKAINSTKRAAHFAGYHESWCDEIDTKTTDNDHIANYRLTNQSLQSFLSKIQAD